LTNLQDSSTWDNIFEHIISIEGDYISLRIQRVETTTDTLTGSENPIRKEGMLFNESFTESCITKQDHPKMPWLKEMRL
jgi:hypothetical protein